MSKRRMSIWSFTVKKGEINLDCFFFSWKKKISLEPILPEDSLHMMQKEKDI
jgi:hypothetical protein